VSDPVIDALTELQNELFQWSTDVHEQATDDLDTGRATGIWDAAVLINDEINSRKKRAT
jgi:hypothetical protein